MAKYKVKEGTLRTVGNKKRGASLLTTKSGAEVQAGGRVLGKDVHLDAGFDTKRKSVGFGLKIGNKRFSKSYLGSGSGKGKGY